MNGAKLIRSRYAASLLVIALLAAQTSAWAGPSDPAEEAATDAAYERHMSLGIRLYEDRAFDAAMIEFERAYELRKRAGPLINLALCHKGRLEYVKAVRVLERAQRSDRVSTEQVTQIDQALKEIRELLAVIELRIQPAAAGVRLQLDGEILAAGSESGPMEVSPGLHSLIVRADGFTPYQMELKLGAGDKRQIDVALVADSGTLVVDTGATGAQVIVDGEYQGSGPVRKLLKGGTHLVTLQRGDDRYTASVAIVPAQETRVSLDERGLMSLRDAAPRGPDIVELPHVEGFYVMGGASAGARVGRKLFFLVGTDLHLGYRIMRNVGVEGYVRQLFADGGLQSPNAMTQLGAAVRLMTSHEPVHFSGLVGLGYSHEAPQLGQIGLPGFHAVAQPEVDGRLSNVVLSFGLPVVFTENAFGESVEISGRLQVGYGVW